MNLAVYRSSSGVEDLLFSGFERWFLEEEGRGFCLGRAEARLVIGSLICLFYSESLIFVTEDSKVGEEERVKMWWMMTNEGGHYCSKKTDDICADVCGQVPI